MMHKLTRSVPPLEELFRFDSLIEQNDVERRQIFLPEDGARTQYLFRCEGLLPAGQLTIDDHRGIVGMHQENIIDLSTTELYLLTALVLSFPYSSVDHAQIQDLSTLSAMNETNDEHSIYPVHDLVTSCNEKLRSLGIAIMRIDTAYQLTAVTEEKEGE